MTFAPKLYILPSVLPDRWTVTWAEDKFGIWSEVEISGVIQRFRWIEPGTFQMGSPEDEPERESIETQHEVELTQGFWPADTACTQQLWQAVTGEKPSRFNGNDLPVEQVSWEDCQQFFKKANLEMLGLNLRFPTEAEWEYACRAGTTTPTTPFSFGENITTELRVLRGGSWCNGGRWCRSAYRRFNPPGYRYDNIGFRLARGQVEPSRAEPQGAVHTEVERSGTGVEPRQGRC